MKFNNLGAKEIFDLYEKGVDYKCSIDLYKDVERNQNFYIGNQWEGVDAPDLPKPVFNIFKRVVNFLVSSVFSDDICIQASPLSNKNKPEVVKLTKAVNGVFEETLEDTKYRSKLRDMLTSCAIDGDGCFYLYFDPSVETGQGFKGAISIENIDNLNVFFGDPATSEVEMQPYIIISKRQFADELREEAKRAGVLDYEAITPDSDEYEINRDNETSSEKVTVLLFLYRDKGTIHYIKTTRNVILSGPIDTGMRRYPIAFMSWDKVKNRYHGQSVIKGLIPNQIFINQLFAKAMISIDRIAFPKVIYNKNAVTKWNNAVGSAIAANAEDMNSVARILTGQGFPPQVMQLIDAAMSYTKELMGATDAALGNVKPDNTSAIIAVQQSSIVPLELVRKNLYQFIEDTAYIMLDIMANYYGRRYYDTDIGEEVIDFSRLLDVQYRLKIDVGGASYFSELAQMQTAEKLFAAGEINGIELIEAIPDYLLKNKQAILLRKREEEASKAGQVVAGQQDLLGQFGEMMY